MDDYKCRHEQLGYHCQDAQCPLPPLSEWQQHMGVGERQPPPPQSNTRSVVATTDTGCIKETVEHASGRVDNYYTIPTQEVGSSCLPD